jgi:LmbE family N-acetylglucosaminyl deacetylase
VNRYAPADILEAPYLNKERLRADIGDTLVLAPHPDDESLGCGGLIALLCAAGARVSVVFITDGSASHTSKLYPPELLTGLREREARKACSELGVSKDHIHFLREKDSGLTDLEATDVERICHTIDAIYREGRCNALAVPWRRDPHPDHIAVHHLGDKIIEEIETAPIKIEYPVWLWKNAAPQDWPLKKEVLPYRLDITEVYDQKWKAINSHRSQLGEIIHDDPCGFVLTPELLKPFENKMEYFFVSPKNDLKTLDKDYFEALYSSTTDPWNFRNSTYEQDKYQRALVALGPASYGYGLELGCSIGIQTRLLAGICRQLTAVDISPVAIAEASAHCADLKHVRFEVADITQEFPQGGYDLITCCELGYYLEKKDLFQLFGNMNKRLDANGRLLLVHWTPFVPDYPLTGDAVHDYFEEFALGKNLRFQEIVHERHGLYRLQLWQKLEGKVAR